MTIRLNDISKSFATRSLFEELSLEINAKDRIGLIGRNGCGKSTLFLIIMGQVKPEVGSIYRAPGMRINYLSQEPKITPNLTLYEEMRSVFSEVNALMEEEAELIRKLGEDVESEEKHMALAERMMVLHEEMDRLDAYNLDARIGRILKGLGFSLADYERKSSDFSGGWQMRINLGKVLLEGADILLLDEPTNHLDMEACEWLENFLTDYPGGLVIASHDRRFLDKVTNKIAEMENGGLKLWNGNYTEHLAQKAEAIENITAAHGRQQKELAKQTAFVERFKASASRGTQAKSREKQLAKIERIELPTSETKRIVVRFPSPEPSGKEALTIRDLSKAFGDKVLFTGLNADIERKQRVFLLGENGCGKTTLMRMLQGLETSDTGEIKLGYNAKIGYFSQKQLETLDLNLSVFQTIQKACPDLHDTELRGLLGRFLFKGDQAFKPASQLSGGEKSKLALAKLMMSGANVLMLDEPTNHMDIPSKDAMTEALSEYEGTILCISHDRHFIQTLATEIWEIHNGRILTYCGDYDYYRFKREEMRAKIPAQSI
ncbi:MAG TPA: ABC-F family ATP-binding cassette domain-containing protein [Coleofasciculaceae cyanobacterium]|jgi:ATP-binding cassette subfamily F protein 3